MAAARPRRRGVRLPLRSSVRNRLVLLFFTITAAAMVFVYLYVVPQLSTNLIAERLGRLEALGPEQAERLSGLLDREADRTAIVPRLSQIASAVDARATLLGVRGGVPSFVIADSDFEADSVELSYPAAAGAVLSGRVRSAVETRPGGERVGETAIPVTFGPEVSPAWALVLSVPLDEVDDNVALIRRQMVIAGSIALAAALIAAWFAASAHARRLRRLEHAAERVAEGDFGVPIPIDSNDEVGQLAASFDEMQGRLARLDSARREFIANASHELRTPIASLGGFIELLDEEEEPDRDSRREFNRLMKTQIERLGMLTAGLLDLSKLDADAMPLTSKVLSLPVVIEEASSEFGPQLTEASVELRTEGSGSPEPHVQADRGRTLQILRILIDNAIKHTPEGTEIKIEASTSDRYGIVSVTDNGPGIPPEGRERVFERFYTADAVSGSGLGLSIARELALRMDGELNLATSRRGRTTFELALPLAGDVR
ncbi:MAG: ATP-binding protein [Solirubrobacterales bacterium]